MSVLNYEEMIKLPQSGQGKRIKQCVIVCKKASSPKTIRKHKTELFKALSPLVVKNVNSFFNLLRGYNGEIIHTKNDLIGEMYIVMDKCIEKCSEEKMGDFHWFFQKAAYRHVLRIIERQYKTPDNNRGEQRARYKTYKSNVSIDEQLENGFDFISGSSNNEYDLTDFYLDNLGMDETHKRIVQSRIDKDKVEDFLKENTDITRNNYYKALNEIKVKLVELE